MGSGENIHEGHRERIINKFINYPDSLSDHEILEMLLFPFIPRKNTNELAHRLLERFGSFKAIFDCPPKTLVEVEGIGSKTAWAIGLCGKLINEAAKRFESKQNMPWANHDIYCREIRSDFLYLYDENLIIYFLDDKCRVFYKLTYGDRNRSSVSAELPEISEKMALKKPRYIIVAHNHPSNNVNPSTDDDMTVGRIMLMCAAHGCGFTDSLIYNRYGEYYSYYLNGRFSSVPELKEIEKQIAKMRGEKYYE